MPSGRCVSETRGTAEMALPSACLPCARLALESSLCTSLAASGSTRAFSPRSTSPPDPRAALSKPGRQMESPVSARFKRAGGGCRKIAPLVAKVRNTLQEAQAVIHWTSDPADAEVFHAIPLTGPVFSATHQHSDQCLTPGESATDGRSARRQLAASPDRIGAADRFHRHAGGRRWNSGGGAGQPRFAARVTRPVVSLAEAARRVAAGIWAPRSRWNRATNWASWRRRSTA